MKKALLILSLVLFGIWMLLVHEPSDLISDKLEGSVSAVRSKGEEQMLLQVTLPDGPTIEVAKPDRMPARVGMRVRLRAYESRWFAERRYEVRNWRLN